MTSSSSSYSSSSCATCGPSETNIAENNHLRDKPQLPASQSSTAKIDLPPIPSFWPPSSTPGSDCDSAAAITSSEARGQNVGALTDPRGTKRAACAPSSHQTPFNATAVPFPAFRIRRPPAPPKGLDGPSRRTWVGGPKEVAPPPHSTRTFPAAGVCAIDSRQRRNTASGSDLGVAPVSSRHGAQVSPLDGILTMHRAPRLRIFVNRALQPPGLHDQGRSSNGQRGTKAACDFSTRSSGAYDPDYVTPPRHTLTRLSVHNPPFQERLAADAGTRLAHCDDVLPRSASTKTMPASAEPPFGPELDGDSTARVESRSPSSKHLMDVGNDAELELGASLALSTPTRRQKLKMPKRVRKGGAEEYRECLGSAAIEPPEWRRGPTSNGNLCGARGLLHAECKRKQAKKPARATGYENSERSNEVTNEKKLRDLEERRVAFRAKSTHMATSSLPYLAQASVCGPLASPKIVTDRLRTRTTTGLPRPLANRDSHYDGCFSGRIAKTLSPLQRSSSPGTAAKLHPSRKPGEESPLPDRGDTYNMATDTRGVQDVGPPSTFQYPRVVDADSLGPVAGGSCDPAVESQIFQPSFRGFRALSSQMQHRPPPASSWLKMPVAGLDVARSVLPRSTSRCPQGSDEYPPGLHPSQQLQSSSPSTRGSGPAQPRATSDVAAAVTGSSYGSTMDTPPTSAPVQPSEPNTASAGPRDFVAPLSGKQQPTFVTKLYA